MRRQETVDPRGPCARAAQLPLGAAAMSEADIAPLATTRVARTQYKHSYRDPGAAHRPALSGFARPHPRSGRGAGFRSQQVVSRV